jgi:hypothetical protein
VLGTAVGMEIVAAMIVAGAVESPPPQEALKPELK